MAGWLGMEREEAILDSPFRLGGVIRADTPPTHVVVSNPPKALWLSFTKTTPPFHCGVG